MKRSRHAPRRGCAGRGGASGRRPAAAPVHGPGLALHPRRPRGRRAARLRRPPVAPAGPAARLEHRGDARGRTPRRRARWATSPRASAGTARRSACPPARAGREAWLEFDGVYMNSDVWINGVHLGRRPYGYTSFAYDITAHLVRGRERGRRARGQLAPAQLPLVHGQRHLPPRLADPRRIRSTSAHWGTYVTTPRADSAGADVVVRTRVENDRAARAPRRAPLRGARRRGPRGRAHGDALRAGRRAGESRWSSGCRSPRRDSGRVETPSLYTLRSEVLDGAAHRRRRRPRPSASAPSRTTRTAASC